MFYKRLYYPCERKKSMKIMPIEKMGPELHELYNLSILKHLNMDRLAAFVGTSSQNIRNWFGGRVPIDPFKKMIAEACVRIKAEPGPNSIADLPGLGEGPLMRWGKNAAKELAEEPEEKEEFDDERKKQEAVDKKFDAQMTRLRDQLLRKAPAEEVRGLNANAGGDAWSVFEDVMFALKKHGIKIKNF
jgi:hypothetical protein